MCIEHGVTNEYQGQELELYAKMTSDFITVPDPVVILRIGQQMYGGLVISPRGNKISDYGDLLNEYDFCLQKN